MSGTAAGQGLGSGGDVVQEVAERVQEASQGTTPSHDATTTLANTGNGAGVGLTLDLAGAMSLSFERMGLVSMARETEAVGQRPAGQTEPKAASDPMPPVNAVVTTQDTGMANLQSPLSPSVGLSVQLSAALHAAGYYGGTASAHGASAAAARSSPSATPSPGATPRAQPAVSAASGTSSGTIQISGSSTALRADLSGNLRMSAERGASMPAANPEDGAASSSIGSVSATIPGNSSVAATPGGNVPTGHATTGNLMGAAARTGPTAPGATGSTDAMAATAQVSAHAAPMTSPQPTASATAGSTVVATTGSISNAPPQTSTSSVVVGVGATAQANVSNVTATAGTAPQAGTSGVTTPISTATQANGGIVTATVGTTPQAGISGATPPIGTATPANVSSVTATVGIAPQAGTTGTATATSSNATTAAVTSQAIATAAATIAPSVAVPTAPTTAGIARRSPTQPATRTSSAAAASGGNRGTVSAAQALDPRAVATLAAPFTAPATASAVPAAAAQPVATGAAITAVKLTDPPPIGATIALLRSAAAATPTGPVTAQQQNPLPGAMIGAGLLASQAMYAAGPMIGPAAGRRRAEAVVMRWPGNSADGNDQGVVSYTERRTMQIDLTPARALVPCWRIDDTQALATVGTSGADAAAARAAALYHALMDDGAGLADIGLGEGFVTWEGSPLWLSLAGLRRPRDSGILAGATPPGQVQVMRTLQGEWLVEHAGRPWRAQQTTRHDATAVDDETLLADVLYGITGIERNGPDRDRFDAACSALSDTCQDDGAVAWRRQEAWALVARNCARLVVQPASDTLETRAMRRTLSTIVAGCRVGPQAQHAATSLDRSRYVQFALRASPEQLMVALQTLGRTTLEQVRRGLLDGLDAFEALSLAICLGRLTRETMDATRPQASPPAPFAAADAATVGRAWAR